MITVDIPNKQIPSLFIGQYTVNNRKCIKTIRSSSEVAVSVSKTLVTVQPGSKPLVRQ